MGTSCAEVLCAVSLVERDQNGDTMLIWSYPVREGGREDWEERERESQRGVQARRFSRVLFDHPTTDPGHGRSNGRARSEALLS